MSFNNGFVTTPFFVHPYYDYYISFASEVATVRRWINLEEEIIVYIVIIMHMT